MKFLDEAKIYLKAEMVAPDALVLEEKNILNLAVQMEEMEEKVGIYILRQLITLIL